MPLDILPALRDVESDLMNWRRSPLIFSIEDSELLGLAISISEFTLS